MSILLKFKWTTSKARDSYGYNRCTLYADGVKVSANCGGGYDMKGTALGNYIEKAFADRLVNIPLKSFKGHRRNGEDVTELYGLTFHDPNFDPGKAEIPKQDLFSNDDTGETWTVAEAEAANQSLGLERYQQFHRASSNIPTERHVIPLIDGACGMSSVERIMAAIDLELVSNGPEESDGYSLNMLPAYVE